MPYIVSHCYLFMHIMIKTFSISALSICMTTCISILFSFSYWVVKEGAWYMLFLCIYVDMINGKTYINVAHGGFSCWLLQIKQRGLFFYKVGLATSMLPVTQEYCTR